jgi:type I restriction enzyme M protein
LTDVVAKLWGFCDYLRHDGMNYGLYIEQLTYLLFLKMTSEKEIKLPKGCNWNELIQYSGSDLLDEYEKVLKVLGKEKGNLGDIFIGSKSQFKKAVNLKKLLNLMDEIEWTEIDVDIKGAAYEGLLEKYAADEKGAGQYFTPRPLIRSIVRCVQPDFVKIPDYTIHDPACGTCGFLIGAFEWIKKQNDGGSKLKVSDRERLIKKTFSGGELVESTRRLGLMNCFLHEIEPQIYLDSSISDGPHVSKRYNLILTNPPFGSSGAGSESGRADFLYQTTNKQLNFVQHVMTILKPGGQCAMIVPDNVLFDSSGEGIRQNLLKQCDLHTILRLPDGTFVPYANAKANVLFFIKGRQTKQTWIYDLRTNIPNIRKGNQLSEKLFSDFEKCYLQKPRNKTERFKSFSYDDLLKKDKTSLDIFCLKDESLANTKNLLSPQEIAEDIRDDLKTALNLVNELITNIEKK